MPIYPITDKSVISKLFDGWNETMIWSCLQDCMGTAYADDLHTPTAAQIRIGGFCFFAGEVNYELLENHPGFAFRIMVPQNSKWADAIEAVYKEKATRHMRYATVKNKDTLSVPKLQTIANGLSAPYTIKRIDAGLYEQILSTDWGTDLCKHFENYRQYQSHGLGFAVLKNGEVVSGASTYAFYQGGIEIEIDTRADERRHGLALICGARLVLECLKQGLYPNWDAHNKGSLALAEKLGYQFDHEYLSYIIG